MPAAAVIPASVASIKVVAVERFAVECLISYDHQSAAEKRSCRWLSVLCGAVARSSTAVTVNESILVYKALKWTP